MTMKELFPNHVMIADCVPIGIAELGFAYMNDIGLWNITINSKCIECIDKTITVGQLKELLAHKSSCYATQQDRFDKELLQLINALEGLDLETKIEF